MCIFARYMLLYAIFHKFFTLITIFNQIAFCATGAIIYSLYFDKLLATCLSAFDETSRHSYRIYSRGHCLHVTKNWLSNARGIRDKSVYTENNNIFMILIQKAVFLFSSDLSGVVLIPGQTKATSLCYSKLRKLHN